MTTSQELTRAERLYPDCFDAEVEAAPSEPSPIIHEFGIPLVRVDEDALAGYTFALLVRDPLMRDPLPYSPTQTGVLIVSLAALQDCESFDDLNSLIDCIEDAIKWFPTLHSACDFITTARFHNGTFYVGNDAWPYFVQLVAAFGAEAEAAHPTT